MNVKATAKYIRVSPRKARLVVDLVRGMEVEMARHQLLFSKKNAAEPVLKALNSAMANAKNNNKLDTTGFVITAATVDDGPTFYRHRPRAHGRSAPIRKRMSHIMIEVGAPEGEGVKEVEKAEKPAEKKAAKKSVAKKAPVQKTTKK
ncbi:50S ribosomal protein L22 [Candidatus Uhrbacteria bacterium]|jgi:large subunit ribosomal protein L22|nr:50S ribosomal protein L22 [Candidatus Uhrbacteria bacterium]